MVTSISIESRSIRVTLSNGDRVVRWSSIEVGEDLVVDGVVTRPEELGTSLRTLLDSLHVKEPRAALAVSGARSAHRYLTVPKLSGALMEKAVLHDAESSLHVPVEELYLFWTKLREHGGEQEVFVLAVPRDVLDSQIAVLRQAGLKPQTIDSKPLCLARAVNRHEAVIVDLEDDAYHIIVVGDGLPRIIRTIQADANAASHAQRLQEEFETSLRLYETAYPDNPLPPAVEVVLTGKMSPSAEALPDTANLLRHPVSLAVSPLKVPAGFPLPEFIVNAGLAAGVAGVGHGRNGRLVPKVNLLPPALLPKKRAMRELVFVPIILVGIVGSVSLFQMYGDAQARSYIADADLQTVTQQMKVKQLESKQLADAELALKAAQTTLQTLQQDRIAVLPGTVQYQPSLKVVGSDNLSGDICLLTVSQSGSVVTVTGAAISHHSVVEYAARLAQSRGFSKIDIVDSHLAKVGGGDAAGVPTYQFIVDNQPWVPGPEDEVALFNIRAQR